MIPIKNYKKIENNGTSFLHSLNPCSWGFTLPLHDKMAKINLNAIRWMGQCYIWRLEIHFFLKIHNILCRVSLNLWAFPKEGANNEAIIIESSAKI
jgi:hypothetical protein